MGDAADTLPTGIQLTSLDPDYRNDAESVHARLREKCPVHHDTQFGRYFLTSGKDIEALHDMRVASRRLREAMEIFRPCYEEEAFTTHYGHVRRVTRTLGAARNLDVCVKFFSTFRKGLSDSAQLEAVAYVLKREKKERRRVRRKMIRKLDKLHLKGMKKALRAFFSDSLVCGGKCEEEQDLVSHARVLLEERLESLSQYREAIGEESNVEALHRMRIAAKKLRYALETLYVLFDERLFDEVYGIVVGLQERLGDIHDLDVFMEMIEDLQEEMEGRKRTQPLLPGMAGVGELLREQRHALYERFLDSFEDQHGRLCEQIRKGTQVLNGTPE